MRKNEIPNDIIEAMKDIPMPLTNNVEVVRLMPTDARPVIGKQKHTLVFDGGNVCEQIEMPRFMKYDVIDTPGINVNHGNFTGMKAGEIFHLAAVSKPGIVHIPRMFNGSIQSVDQFSMDVEFETKCLGEYPNTVSMSGEEIANSPLYRSYDFYKTNDKETKISTKGVRGNRKVLSKVDKKNKKKLKKLTNSSKKVNRRK